MITNLIFNRTKNTRFHILFFIYMSSMCVQLFTAFEEAVLKLYICSLVSALKFNLAAISMETNREKKYFDFFILIIINIQ